MEQIKIHKVFIEEATSINVSELFLHIIPEVRQAPYAHDMASCYISAFLKLKPI